jgi:hypothetical protein
VCRAGTASRRFERRLQSERFAMKSVAISGAAGLLLGATVALAQTGTSATTQSQAGKVWILNEAGTAANKPADPETTPSGRRSRGRDVTGSTTLAPKLRSVVAQAIGKAHVRPVGDIDFPLRVGTVVPTSIRLRPLPPAILNAKPGWRGHEFFVTGDEIVIVQPTTSKIVEVHRYKE